MHVLTILGSPRLHGHTATVLEWLEEALRQKGCSIDRVNAVEITATGCRECFACKSGREELCTIKDEANEVMRKIVGADAVVFAAPVFCWGFPAQLKVLQDRMYCLFDVHADGTYVSKIPGKIFALVVTAGGGLENNADILQRAYNEMIGFMDVQSAGALIVTDCVGPESLTMAVKERAAALAEAMTAR